jgi:hypothetical protein
MKAGLAQHYLIQALSMKRKNVGKLQQRIENGQCIMDACESRCVSRGLCDRHRQQYYAALRQQDGDAARVEFEQKMIREGLILVDGEQQKWSSTNPFTKAAS